MHWVSLSHWDCLKAAEREIRLTWVDLCSGQGRGWAQDHAVGQGLERRVREEVRDLWQVRRGFEMQRQWVEDASLKQRPAAEVP